MSNYNLDRGQTLYYNELKKYSFKKPDLSEDIMALGSLFDKVGVMQEGPVSSFTFTESSLTYDFVPSYKRLANLVANACFVKSTSEEEINQEELVNLVFKNWDNRSLPVNKIPEGVERKYLPNDPAKTEEEIINDSSYQEILSNTENLVNLVELNEDFSNYAYDEIDLLEDLAEYLDEDDEAFTDEGKRALGLIDQDFDSTESELIGVDGESVKKFKQEFAIGEVNVDQDGEFTIICPYTGSSDVYQISTNLFASYETDQPFKVKFSLSDTSA
jgi:hypothetical protein